MIQIIPFSHSDKELYKKALEIRQKVFIEEQQVERTLEIENEEDSHFYLLQHNGLAIGTARWRKTHKGIKLERFAVLPEFRNKNMGTILLKKVLEDLSEKKEKIYLHAQLKAVNYYKRQGFEEEGEMFVEANIKHFLMVKA
ncbi:MAG: GNAT family N-acetyltransferase [Bacteroidales bacterium]|nr:GNAT family N-acetyltransferase [Bacteroidales bacterium]